MKTSQVIRIIITIGFLWFVWQGALWAIALAITLLSIRCELEDWIRVKEQGK